MTCNLQAIVIGVSAGAFEALNNILPALPHDYPLPVIVVVHLPADKDSLLVELFTTKCFMLVKEAEDKEPVQPGVIYFAPPDYHLQIEKEKYFSLSSEEPVFFSRPAIDILFETAADSYGSGLIGIILTGANNDGANGLKTIREAGGIAIVQSPSSAYAAAMPLGALDECPDAIILNLKEIAQYLQEAVG